MADDRDRRKHADLRPDRLRQDADRVPVGDRQPREGEGAAAAGRRGGNDRGLARLRIAAEGPLLRRRAQPAGAARRDRRRSEHRPAHGRHSAAGAAGDAPQAAGHPDHHAGVAVSDADVAGAEHPHRRRVADRRRDPRRRADQARRPHGADAGAARTPRAHECRGRRRSGAADPADRALGDAAPARADRPVPRRPAPGMRDRQRRHPQGDGPGDRRAGPRHGGPRLHGSE